MIERNKSFLEKARALEPVLLHRAVHKAPDAVPLAEGDRLVLDFGEHLVGFLSLRLDFTGSHPDAPVWLRVRFAEREQELSERVEDYHGWISSSWVQQEQLHVDVLPGVVSLQRRYAFRYVSVEVLGISSKYRLIVREASVDAVTSADENALLPFESDDEQLRAMDRIACHTLRDCMQRVFEDGPKRDRRLWMGDLRLQALANYETYQNHALVKRCLYLFAGSTLPDGKVGAGMFLDPEIEVDDTEMFDYALLFAPTLLDYVRVTNDTQTLQELWPTAKRQIELARTRFDQHDVIRDSDVLGWCFLDWNLALNKQAGAQGVYLYALQAALELARMTGDREFSMFARKELAAKRRAALERLYDPDLGLFISGAKSQVSYASQIWMVLGGVVSGEEAAQLLQRVAAYPDAVTIVTPYLYHHYIQALLDCGEKARALETLRYYWGGMVDAGADTFWELYNPDNPEESPYGGTIVNSYCHAWSCAPAYFLRKYFQR